MRVFRNQIIGGTAEDTQGERLPLEALQRFVTAYEGKRQPLNQGHDFGKTSVGYIENLRVEDHPTIEGEYALVGDVYCAESKLEEVIGGFSISYLEVTKRSKKPHEFIVYLPFPYYSDVEFIDQLDGQNRSISIGKWVKKAADPTTIALIGAAAVFILKPVWDDLYKTVFAPKIYDFFRSNRQLFTSRSISSDLIQTVDIDGHQIQVILVPDRNKEEICFNPEYLDQSMQIVHRFILNHSHPKNIARVHVYFHSEWHGYKIHRVEDLQGNIEHHA